MSIHLGIYNLDLSAKIGTVEFLKLAKAWCVNYMYKMLFLALLNTKNIDSFLCNGAMQFTLDCHSDYLYTGEKTKLKNYIRKLGNCRRLLGMSWLSSEGLFGTCDMLCIMGYMA